MPKLILRCNYLKNSPPSHLANYINYVATREGVEKVGTHGLFSNEGEIVQLTKVVEEVANHPGVIWTNVISLRREDVQRLGYDSEASGNHYLEAEFSFLVKIIK